MEGGSPARHWTPVVRFLTERQAEKEAEELAAQPHFDKRAVTDDDAERNSHDGTLRGKARLSCLSLIKHARRRQNKTNIP